MAISDPVLADRPRRPPRRSDSSDDATTAEQVAQAAYDLAGILAMFLCLPVLPFLLARGGVSALRQRLGLLPKRRAVARPVWLHAASVGETLTALPLVAELRRRMPETPILLSTTSTTGRDVALREAGADLVTLLPVDVPCVVDRFVRRVRPRCLILLETEIWPGLLRAVDRTGAPSVVVSGRLSARSLGRYRWAAPLFRTAVRRIAVFGMQTAEDAERLVSMGASPARVHVTGSLKGGVLPTAGLAAPVGGLSGRRVLIGASTQPGEEEFLLESCAGLWPRCPDLLLLLAPRRPERFGAVRQMVEARGLRCESRSAARPELAADTQVFLLDSTGELPRFFSQATAVFVGGTVAPLGGHNVLEPASFAKPVAFGPHTANVAAAAARLIETGGGRLVSRPVELATFWDEMLSDSHASARLGALAETACEGALALERTWQILAPYLGSDQ